MNQRSRHRKLLYGLLITVLLVLMAGLLVPAVVDVNRFIPLIRERIAKQIGREVEIQGLRLSLAGGIWLTASGLTIADDPQFAPQPFLTAETLSLRFSLLSLLSGSQDPAAAELGRPTIHLRRAAGRWNVQSLQPAAAAAPAGSTTAGQIPTLPALAVRDGTVHIHAGSTGDPDCSLHRVSFELGPRLLGSGLALDTGFSLDAAGTSRIRVRGSLPSLPTGLQLPAGADVETRATGLSLQQLAQALTPLGYRVPALLGTLELDGRLASEDGGALSLSGELALENLARAGGSPGEEALALHVRYDAGYRERDSAVQLRSLDLRAGETSIRLSGQVSEVAAEPSGDLRVEMRDGRPADLLRLAVLARGGAAPASTSGTVSADLRLTGKLANPRLSGSLQSQELQFVYPDLPDPVRLSRIEVQLDGDRLQTNEFHASVARRATVALSARIEKLGTDPEISFRARTSEEAPLLELLRIGASLGTRLPPGLAIESGRASFDVTGERLRPKSGRFSVSGHADLRDARLRLDRLRQPLSIPSLSLQLAAGRVTSNRFRVDMGSSGSVHVSLSIQDTTDGPSIDAGIKTDQPLDAEEWVTAGREFGYALPAGGKLTGGRVDLDVQAHAPPSGRPQVRGSVIFRDGIFTSDLSPEPLRLTTLDLDLQPDRLTIRSVDAGFLETTFRGRATVVLGEAPSATMELRADFVDAQRLQAALAPASRRTQPPAGADSAESGPLARLSITDSRLLVQRVNNDTLELSNLTADFRYSPKVLHLDPLRFELYSGTHQGQLRLDLGGPTPRFQYQGKLAGVDVHALLSRNTTMRNILHGRLESTSALMGQGAEFQTIAAGVQGNGIYRLADGRITTFNLGRQISILSRLAGWNLEGTSTELQEAEGSFRVENGRLWLDNSRIRTPEALVLSTGSVGLDRSLDLRGTAELSDQWQISGNALGQVIAGAAATFFRNEAGRIVVPFHLGGTLEEPAFVLDNETLQAGLAQLLRPENIRSGVEAVGKIIEQVSRPGSSRATTTTTPASPQGTPTTTQPGPGQLAEGIAGLVGGIIGAVTRQPGAADPPPDRGPITADPALTPNVTDLMREIQTLAALPLLSESDRRARVQILMNAIFAVPSPRP